MSEHVRVEREGAVLATARPARSAQRDHRRDVRRAGRRDRRRCRDPRAAIPSAARARISPPATTSPTSSGRCQATSSDIPVWRLLRALAECQIPLVARSTAMRSASARLCCSTASRRGRGRQRASRCRSSTSPWSRKRRALCFCRASPAAVAPRATAAGRPFGPRKRLTSGWSAMSRRRAGSIPAWSRSSEPCWPNRPRGDVPAPASPR